MIFNSYGEFSGPLKLVEFLLELRAVLGKKLNGSGTKLPTQTLISHVPLFGPSIVHDTEHPHRVSVSKRFSEPPIQVTMVVDHTCLKETHDVAWNMPDHEMNRLVTQFLNALYVSPRRVVLSWHDALQAIS